MSDRLGSTLAAILTGAVVGVGIGILFAPDEGKKTRRKIKRSFDQSKEELEHKFEDLKKKVKHMSSKKSNDLQETIEDLIHTSDKKREDIIALLEHELAALKKQGKELAETAKK